MSTPEIFNQARMERCTAIAGKVMGNFRRTNSFECIVRATQAVHGLALSDLRTHYFAVGISNDLTEVPFTDLLVILSLMEQEWAAVKHGKRPPKFTVTTEYTDHEASRLLSMLPIETPFDPGKALRIQVIETEIDEAGDDPPTPQ